MAVAIAKRKQKQIDKPSKEQVLGSVDDDARALLLALQADPVLFARIACQFQPHRKQIEVLNAPLERLKTMLPWFRRGGKTAILAIRIAWSMFSRPDYRAYIFSPSGDQSTILWEAIQDLYAKSEYLKRYTSVTVKGNRITVGGKDWGSYCEYIKTGLTGDNARGRGVKAGNGLCVFDEISSFYDAESVTSAIKPYLATGGGLVYLSSPGEIGSWMHKCYLDWKEMEQAGSSIHKVIECDWTDVDHIDREFVAEEKREAKAKGRLWQWEREYLGRWTHTEGAFFERQDVERCQVKGSLTGERGDVWIYSLDPGLDRACSCLLVARWNPLVSRLEITDCVLLARHSNEHVKADAGVQRVDDYLDVVDLILDYHRHRPIHTLYIDPGTEKTIGEKLKNRHGVNVVECRVGNYGPKLTALRDLQRCLIDQSIVWQDQKITRQLVNFAPPLNRTTGRYDFKSYDKDYDIIAALTQLQRYIGDRKEAPYILEYAKRRW